MLSWQNQAATTLNSVHARCAWWFEAIDVARKLTGGLQGICRVPYRIAFRTSLALNWILLCVLLLQSRNAAEFDCSFEGRRAHTIVFFTAPGWVCFAQLIGTLVAGNCQHGFWVWELLMHDPCSSMDNMHRLMCRPTRLPATARRSLCSCRSLGEDCLLLVIRWSWAHSWLFPSRFTEPTMSFLRMWLV